MIRILLVDDIPSIREEMRRLLELEEDIQVIGEAADGWEAIKSTRTLEPDLILMDQVMPSLDGIEATRIIKKYQPQARIIFLAAEEIGRSEALAAGAEAYFLKEDNPQELIKAVREGNGPRREVAIDLSLLGRKLQATIDSIPTQKSILIGAPLALLLAGFLIWGGAFFALIGLSLGLFFFAYALKYYASIALILLFNGENGLVNGNGHGEGKGLRNGLGNGLRKIFGNGVDNAFANGYHLKPETQPFVSIHLPLYNEKKVVNRLLTACTSLDYENYEVIVADDSTDETTQILEQRWAEHPRVKISHRQDRKGFKGGALQVALQHTDPRARFIVLFDADFIPPPDVITQFLAYFYSGNGDGQRYADDRVAVVQGYQWHMLNASENWITRGIRVEFSGSYVIERPGQQLLGSMKMISGSVFMIRADVLRKHGWGISITEDWELTLRLYLDGYKVLYTPFIQAPAECISRFQELVKQRMRWARGHTFNVKKYFWRVLTSPHISWREKTEFLYYAPYYLQSIFFILGTSCWFISELILHRHIPYWTALLGWGLVFSNLFSLVIMNLSGLFLERGVKHNWSGIFSFIVLSNLLVPFQAYAALTGLLEKDEGGWHRTLKSGHITEMLRGLRLGKKLRRLLPKSRNPWKAPAHAEAVSEPGEAIPPDIYNIPIQELHLSTRVFNLLKEAGITVVGQILERLDLAQEDLLAIRGFGPKAVEEVKAALEQKGFLLPPEEIEAGIPEKIYETPIERLNLSTRVFNLLQRAGITLVGQILQHLDKAKQDILAIHYFGPRALLEVKRALYRRGLLSASQVPLEARLPALAPPKLVPLPGRTERFVARAYVRLLGLVYLVSGKLEDKGLLTTEKRASHRRWGARGSLRPLRPRPTAQRRLMSPASAIIIVILAAMLGLTVMALTVEAAAGNSSTFWFYDDTTPLTYMMYQSQPSGSSTSSGSDRTFYSDTFQAGQSLESGTATVYLYATNGDWQSNTIGLTLRAGSTVIGSGSISVPAYTSSPQLFSTSFSTSAYDFAEGERLSLEVDVPPWWDDVDIYWDGSYNNSRLETATIIPENIIAFVIMAPVIPLLIAIFSRKRRATLLTIALTASLIFNLTFLSTNVPVVYAAPDVFYVHDADTTGINPPGEYMNTTVGTGGTTLTLDTVGQNAYWYTDLTYPTGGDDATIAAGPYTLNMYFNELPRPWWNSNYQYRQKITVTAGSSNVPSGYSVSVTLNHASLVTAGKSQADGDDIRMGYWNGSTWVELDRVLDASSSWNNASTKVWFKTQAAIGASASDNNYYLYYGNPAAVSPPTNRANIYLFFDDFEAGNLNKWTADGLWSIATDQAHGGTYSAKYPSEGVSLRYLVANPALNVDNVYVDAWQRLSGVSNNGLNQILRKASGAQSSYVTSVQSSSGWDISKEINGAYTQLSPPAGTASANTWTRIGFGIYGTGVRVFKNGTQINPASGSYNVGTQLASGNIGLEKVWVASGNSWWVDDVTVRRYVDPEPTTSLGAEATSGNVQITVSVYHTKADGTDPQLIVTSASTTINSSTANPYALNIGSGAQQTFTSSDPRRLRAQINVTSINGGERFVLAYDSGTNPTNLATPVVTVPENILFLALVVPTIPLAISLWRRRRKPLKGGTG